MNNPKAIRDRLLKYLIPVIIFAIGFNVPKFMEATIVYKPVNQTVNVTTINGSFEEGIDVDWRPTVKQSLKLTVSSKKFYHIQLP